MRVIGYFESYEGRCCEFANICVSVMIKKRNKGKVIKGGKRSDKYDAVARKEGETGGVGWWRRVRESVRRITSYLMLRGDSEKGKKRRTR